MMMMRTTMRTSLVSCLLLVIQSHGFGIPEMHAAVETSSWIATAASSSSSPSTANVLVHGYQQALQQDPLKTQVATGVALAVVGDAIGQQASDETTYDTKRAVSFAAFDGCYRVAQHVLYPPMIALCHGQILGPALTAALGSSSSSTVSLAAAMEQSLVSQVVIIPLLYYPVFFAVTGAVQGLSVEQTIQRAKTTFWPLMKRNWLFWIPVQFGVFGFCPDKDLQISILIACGLVWTVILSVLAGAAKTADDAEEKSVEETFPEEDMVGVTVSTGFVSGLTAEQQNEQVPVFDTESVPSSRR